MIKEYKWEISILTHDLVKEKDDEKQFINSTMNQLFLGFLHDNININQPYIIKFEKVRYTDNELLEAEEELMSRYFYRNTDKSLVEIRQIVRERIIELNPYHLKLLVEVKDE